MGSTLEWVMRLSSGQFVSGANSAAKAVDNLNGKMRTVNTSTKQLEAQTTKSSSVINDAMTAAGGAAVAAAAAIGLAVGALAVKGAQAAVDATTFRENSIAAFETILKSQQAAVAIFDKADALAGRLGLQDEQVVGQLKKLMASGFGADQALAVIKTAADLAAVMGEEAAGTFATLIASVEAKGKFDTRALNQLAKLGIKSDEIYTNLAKKLGKTNAEVAALIKAGKIDTVDAVEAITKTVDEKFGGAAEKIAGSVPRLLFRIKDAIGDMFNQVNLEPLKAALRGVLDALNGPAGDKIKAGLSKIFGAGFDALLGGINAGQIAAVLNAVGDALVVIGDTIVAAAPSIKAFFGAMIDGVIFLAPMFMAIGGAIKAVVVQMEEWGILLPIMKGIGYAVAAIGAALGIALIAAGLLLLPLYLLIGAIGAVVAAVVWVGQHFSEIPGIVGEALAGAGEWLFEAGANMIMGLVNGIISNGSTVVNAIVGVAKDAINAAKNALGIASPSKVFGEMGAFTAQGFGEGIAANDTAPAAMEAMVAPPSTGSAQAAGKSAGKGAAGGGSVSMHIDQVIIQSSGKEEDYESGFAAVLEKMRFAVGA